MTAPFVVQVVYSAVRFGDGSDGVSIRLRDDYKWSHYSLGEAPSAAVCLALGAASRRVARYEVPSGDGFTVKVVFVTESGEPISPPEPPPDRQTVVVQWARRVLGDAAMGNLAERGLRVAEEAIELAQAMQVSAAELHRLVDYVYARPVGRPGQEIAGTMVTLYAAAGSLGVDADAEFDAELQRIQTPEVEQKIRLRQTEKRERGLTADAVPPETTIQIRPICPHCRLTEFDTGVRRDPDTGELRKRCYCRRCQVEFWKSDGAAAALAAMR